nr:peptidoglycan editing factor PgeF [Ornithinicoccus halotolerans]
MTDRWGGASVEPFGELNLGGRVGDTAEAVETNRHRLARALGLHLSDLRFMRQVHSAAVSLASEEETEPVECDGIVTDRTDVALVVLVADCTPVLLADRTTGVVGAAHAGRVGMMAGVVPATVRRMRALGAEQIEAVVGPSICARCYEVPAEMRDEAADVVPVAASVSWTGTPAIDVAGAVVEQLHAEEVRVRWLPGCSRESPDLYSHRREAPTGRYAGVVRLLPPEGAA